jgi:hypothetical protein
MHLRWDLKYGWKAAHCAQMADIGVFTKVTIHQSEHPQEIYQEAL